MKKVSDKNKQDMAPFNRTVAIIQARMGSTRLPGKVLMDIAGEPMLVWVVERTSRSKCLDEVIVATSSHSRDDAIEELCIERGYNCFRGDELDVLDRYYQAAKMYRAGTVVRITADCPLIDPELIDLTVKTFQRKNFDFVANRLPPPWQRTYPEGLDVEVCTFNALQDAWENATKPDQREHVMPYLYEEEGRYRIDVLNYVDKLDHFRFSVDEQADLELVRSIFRHFEDRVEINWREIVSYLKG